MATSERLQSYDLSPELEPIPGQPTVTPRIHHTTIRSGPQSDKPLISRDQVNRALPGAKIVASAAGWGNSIITTVLCTIQLERFAYDRTTWLSFALGVVLAFGLIAGQVFTMKRSRIWYAAFLFPDALMTSLQWCQWILFPLAFKLFPWLTAALVASILGGVLGIISARMPEKLTFGK